MENHDTTRQNPESGKEVAKEKSFATSAFSKFTPSFWQDKVYRPTYTSAGQRTEVAEFWCRIQHEGRREALSLGTNTRDQAARRAATLYKRVKAAGWKAALAEFAPDRGAILSPTVGEYLAAVQAVIDVHPRTFRNYCGDLRRLVGECFGVRGNTLDTRSGGLEAWKTKIHAIRLERLTADKVQAALTRRVQAAKGNPLAEKTARTTAAGLLRQAKALFNPRLQLPFKDLPNPFDGVHIKGATPAKYSSFIDAPALLRDARTDLAQHDPEAYKAFLLAIGAGLRKAEIDNLCWPQIDASQNIIRVETTANFKPKSDESEGQVFVDPGLVTELLKFKPQATGSYVLESQRAPRTLSPTSFYRAADTFDKLVAWLRSKGVNTFKPLHTLRKEFGSLINAASDIHAASRQLRHASISTTAAFYADSRRRVAPPIGTMLNSAEGKESNATA